MLRCAYEEHERHTLLLSRYKSHDVSPRGGGGTDPVDTVDTVVQRHLDITRVP